ncbi:MAG: hypothetical protein LC708_02325 [Actinobacteria bacterium]|nr:hypothetical protein [Actinomycetota bacterium]
MAASASSLTPRERSLRAALAAHTQHQKGRTNTAPAIDASPARLAYFERQVDPEGQLAPEERQRRAEHARKAHFLRLSLASSKARRARKQAS